MLRMLSLIAENHYYTIAVSANNPNLLLDIFPSWTSPLPCTVYKINLKITHYSLDWDQFLLDWINFYWICLTVLCISQRLPLYSVFVKSSQWWDWLVDLAASSEAVPGWLVSAALRQSLGQVRLARPPAGQQDGTSPLSPPSMLLGEMLYARPPALYVSLLLTSAASKQLLVTDIYCQCRDPVCYSKLSVLQPSHFRKCCHKVIFHGAKHLISYLFAWF